MDFGLFQCRFSVFSLVFQLFPLVLQVFPDHFRVISTAKILVFSQKSRLNLLIFNTLHY